MKKQIAERFDKLGEFFNGPWVDLHEYPPDHPEFSARIEKLYGLVADLKGETEKKEPAAGDTGFPFIEEEKRQAYERGHLEGFREGRAEAGKRILEAIEEPPIDRVKRACQIEISGVTEKPVLNWTGLEFDREADVTEGPLPTDDIPY